VFSAGENLSHSGSTRPAPSSRSGRATEVAERLARKETEGGSLAFVNRNRPSVPMMDETTASWLLQ